MLSDWCETPDVRIVLQLTLVAGLTCAAGVEVGEAIGTIRCIGTCEIELVWMNEN